VATKRDKKRHDPSPGIIHEQFDEMKAREEASAEIESRLDDLSRRAAEAWDEKRNSLAHDMLVLIDAFKRKRTECRDYREHLDHLRQFLRDSWDEEERHFDPNSGVATRLPDHWCPVMIEELDEILAEGTVWMPH